MANNTRGTPKQNQISVRFGDEVLQAGFTTVPNLVLNHYAELEITPAEMMFTIHIWQYWWTEREPYPSLGTIAAKMNVTWRQVHRYVQSLKEKELLKVHSRYLDGVGQASSEYDFSPLIRAIVGLSQRDAARTSSGSAPPLTDLSEGGMTKMSGAPLTPVSYEEDEVKNTYEEKDKTYLRKALPRAEVEKTRDSVAEQRDRRTAGFESAGKVLERRSPRGAKPAKAYDEDRQAILSYVEDFARELGDRSSLKISTSRAYNLFKQSGLTLEDFLNHMYQARAITKEQSAQIRQGQDGHKARMAYFFGTLKKRVGLGEEESDDHDARPNLLPNRLGR